MARTMLMDYKLTDIFWTHAMHRTVHIQKRVMLRNNNEKNPYELWKGNTNNNLYIKVTQGSILLIEIYVDDIVFGSTNDKLSQKFEKDMQMNLKCHYLENYPSFWVFRYVKETKEFVFLKISILEKC
jgi:hypothetical protein